jgi:lipoprotein-anchoring transpeptidase ErfK/SrfK
LRSSADSATRAPYSRSDFSQKSTRIHLLYRRNNSPVELAMRRHAVILAAALAWLIGIERAEARLDILVDKATQRMLVIQDGYMRYMWPVSTGRDETATPNGVYAPQRLERSWFSNAYYNSPMPYSIFFHNGYAIHGSYAIDKLGGPASHGCVRLHPHHAALLFDLVQREGPDKTTIEVTDEPRLGEQPLPPRVIAAGPSLVPPREMATGASPIPPREIPTGAGPIPPREIAAGASFIHSREIPTGTNLVPPREMAAERPLYPPVQRIVRYREPGDMPELSPAQRSNRPMGMKNTLPPRPPPARRRLLADVRASANMPRAPSGPAAAADRAPSGAAAVADSSPRPSEESFDSRPKPRIAEGTPPEQAQQAQSIAGFKLLPTSCWSGGASRWRWWGSSQAAPCK